MPRRALWICGLFAAEMVAIVLAFQVLSSIECRQTTIELACRGLRGVVVRTLCLGALIGVYLWATATARQTFVRMVTQRSGGQGWVLLHLVALTAIFVPLLLVAPSDMNNDFGIVFPILVAGALLAVLGGLFWLAAPKDWMVWLQQRTGALLGIAIVAFLLPGFADLIGPLWYWETLTRVTFQAVAGLMSLFTDVLLVLPERQIIGTNGFVVAVADSCSGIEGFALITAFLGIYAALFRDTIHLGRFVAVVWPVALFVSWCFNVVRITALILIGAFASPELAANGFHSFAGWLFFILLSFAVLIAVNRIAWLQNGAKPPAADTFRLFEDDVAARIVPFIVFMLSGVIAQAFWTDPALAWPVQAGLMALTLWGFRHSLMQVMARPGMAAVFAGLVVGVGWVLTAPAPESASAALTGLTPVMFGLWAMTRILGTAILVPVIEEMFFRGYVQARLDDGRWPRRVAAIAVSGALFALLHGRWLEAGLASVVFSLLYMRKGRLADAITAHAIANALIAAVAAWRGDWSLI